MAEHITFWKGEFNKAAKTSVNDDTYVTVIQIKAFSK